jgi:DNA-binding beta-propeller fold protein YncE
MNIPLSAMAGPNLQVFALVTDLSGNAAAATPITLTIDPAITIATPPGLIGGLLVDGTPQQLVDPRAIVASPKDGHLYVADNAGTTGCTPSCIWRVDPTSGAVDPTPVYVGTGVTEGIAVDATGDNMYISDRASRVVRLTYSGGYATPTACNDVAQQRPQDPFHLAFDATLGILVVDGNRKEVTRVATCTATTAGTTFSMAANFDSPRGIALGPSGEIYVSDLNRDEVLRVDRSTGAVSGFENNLNGPSGMEWLAGGTSGFAGSLMVASSDRTVTSTKGNGKLAAAYLRNTPIDLTFVAGTMMILTAPSNGNRGRIYRISGF